MKESSVKRIEVNCRICRSFDHVTKDHPKVLPLGKEDFDFDYISKGMMDRKTIRKDRLVELLKAVVGEIEKEREIFAERGAEGAEGYMANDYAMDILKKYFGRVYPDLFAGERE